MTDKLCSQCGKPIQENPKSPPYITRLKTNRYCSYECYKAYYKNLSNSPYKGKTSATTGAISELRVSIDLLTKGYDVFRALSPSCPCDLAVLKNSSVLRIEVRTVSSSPKGTIYKVKSKRDDKNNIDVYAWVTPNNIIYEPPLNNESSPSASGDKE